MAKMVKHSSKQNVGHQNEDRLSDLPDVLLHQIFCFLDSEDVVRTCLLSKRWTHFWSSFPFINLFSKNKVNFVKFSNSLLFHPDRSDVITLRVRCNVDIAKNVNSWIIFVSKCKVQVLEIEFDRSIVHNNDEEQSLAFTHCIYRCASLRVLKMKLPYYFYYKLSLPDHVYLPCLEVLYFWRIEFDDDCLRRLISSCPRLQSLTMYQCKFFKDQVSISCPKLETLIISNSSVLSLDICAPCLTNLGITHDDLMIHSIRSISDFPYLVTANIDVHFPSLASYHKVLIAVRNAQSLYVYIDDFLLEDLLTIEPHADKWIPCPFDNLKHLKLDTEFRECEILVIIEFLKASPNLETLVLRNCGKYRDGGSKDFDPWSSKIKLDCLTQVQFTNFNGIEDEMNLVTFFIYHAENLKKLTLEIWADAVNFSAAFAEVTRLLLESLRRCNFSFHYDDELFTVTFI